MSPAISTSFDYEGRHILVDWYEVSNKEAIPPLAWRQVYVIGNLGGQVPLVTNAGSSKPYNLPGGTVEAHETLEQTMTRELVEECNMRVVSWEPLGYQILTEPDGSQIPQFRAYAVVEKIGEFTHDPGGAVVANTLIPVAQLEAHIQYGTVGTRMMELAQPHFVQK
jgi:8-oxo-dGTP pyrophosphatase MutT (NUDIX family)